MSNLPVTYNVGDGRTHGLGSIPFVGGSTRFVQLSVVSKSRASHILPSPVYIQVLLLRASHPDPYAKEAPRPRASDAEGT